MKNVILLSLLSLSSIALAAEEEGSGTTPSSANASNQEAYVLICQPSVNDNESQYCVLVEVEPDQ